MDAQCMTKWKKIPVPFLMDLRVGLPILRYNHIQPCLLKENVLLELCLKFRRCSDRRQTCQKTRGASTAFIGFPEEALLGSYAQASGFV